MEKIIEIDKTVLKMCEFSTKIDIFNLLHFMDI